MGKKLTNEEFLQRLKDNDIKHIPLEEYKLMNTKIKWRCFNNTNHIFEATPSDIFQGYGCPYCSGRKAFAGETDLWTTHPEIASMLEDVKNGYKYSYGSGKKLNWICPVCNNFIEEKSIETVVKRGLSCPICSDGISYSEKFIMNILKQLNIDFNREKIFDWSNKKIYDFYIPKFNMIIESHGIQHYVENKFYSDRKRTLDEERKNDEYKRTLALSNGILKYVILDCRKSEKDFVKKSILKSELSSIFDLSIIDWDLCDMLSHKSYYNYILDCYNNGITNPIDISKLVGVHRNTVINALHKMTDNNICDYDSKKSSLLYAPKIHYKQVICVETGKIYKSMKSTEFDGFNPKCVSECCRGRTKTHKGYHWKLYNVE